MPTWSINDELYSSQARPWSFPYSISVYRWGLNKHLTFSVFLTFCDKSSTKHMVQPPLHSLFHDSRILQNREHLVVTTLEKKEKKIIKKGKRKKVKKKRQMQENKELYVTKRLWEFNIYSVCFLDFSLV